MIEKHLYNATIYFHNTTCSENKQVNEDDAYANL